MPKKPATRSPQAELETRRAKLFHSFVGPEPKGAYTELLLAGGKGYKAAFEFANAKHGGKPRLSIEEQAILSEDAATPLYEQALAHYQPELLAQAANIHLAGGNLVEARKMARLHFRMMAGAAHKALASRDEASAAAHMALAAETARIHLTPGQHITIAVSAIRHALFAGQNVNTLVMRHSVDRKLAAGLVSAAFHAHLENGNAEKAIAVVRAHKDIWPGGEKLLQQANLANPRPKPKAK